MSEFSKITMSGNIGEASFTLRGDTGVELVEQAKDLANSLDAVYEELAKAKQVVLAKEVFSSRQKPAGNGALAGAANASSKSAGASGGAGNSTSKTSDRSCKHGPREYREGTSKAGKDYKAHFCTSTDRSDQCAAEFVK